MKIDPKILEAIRSVLNGSVTYPDMALGIVAELHTRGFVVRKV